MQLSKSQKIIIGILHFLPIVGFILYIIFFFFFFLGTIENIGKNGTEPNPAEFFSGFIGAFLIIMISVIIAIGIKVFDIIHVVKTNKNDTGNKVLLWVLLFIFTGSVGEIIYYFMEILPEKNDKITEEQTQKTY